MLKMRCNYAEALYRDDDVAIDEVREAVTTLEEIERIARRVFGGSHPLITGFEFHLTGARLMIRVREGDDMSSVCEALAAKMAAITPGDA